MRNATYELPVKPYPKRWAWLLRWLQRKCQHYAMKADLLEGGSRDHAVRWCETCGASWITVGGTPCGLPRMCEPTYEKPHSCDRIALQREAMRGIR